MLWTSAVLVTSVLFPVARADDPAFSDVEALLDAGQYDRAWTVMQPLLAAEPTNALLATRAGAIRLAQGDLAAAAALFDRALAHEAELSAPARAALYNDLGRLQLQQGDPVKAAGALRRAVEIANTELEPGLARLYRLNLARALLARTDVTEALAEADALAAALRDEPARARKANQLIGLGALYRDAVDQYSAPARYRLEALAAWKAAEDAAASVGDARLQSYALGLAGELYEQDGRFGDSLDYARRAVFAAQQAEAPESLYRWEWLVARDLKCSGDADAALAAYRRTITTLRSIRSDLQRRPDGFQSVVGPVYYQYADVLMQSAGRTSDARRESLLLESRDAVEELKFAEVEDYFGNQCLASRGRPEDVQRIDRDAAVLYSVVFDDRLELLLSRGDQVTEYRVNVPRAALDELTRRLRLELQTAGDPDGHLADARALYDVLIRPLEAELDRQPPGTLVFVPDGSLRTIPLGALYDGRRYLVERFALATSPGLTLTDPRPIAEAGFSVFAGGLSDAVQGFPALPGVDRELSALADEFATPVYRNTQFSTERVTAGLQAGGYDIAHFATHGQFRGNYADSFLLTYGDRLSIDQLSGSIQSRQLQSGPLELVVMSACETAAGDDRAALGLAGLAIRAGARSALATLWAVDDAATARLVESFYRGLKEQGLSKSASLRQAQLALLGDAAFADPGNWAPFLLIGNWL